VVCGGGHGGAKHILKTANHTKKKFVSKKAGTLLLKMEKTRGRTHGVSVPRHHPKAGSVAEPGFRR